MKEILIQKVKDKYNNVENKVFMDCSRYENSYEGYADSREHYNNFADGSLNIDEYLSGISEEKLTQMLK